jgi:cytochrome P450
MTDVSIATVTNRAPDHPFDPLPGVVELLKRDEPPSLPLPGRPSARVISRYADVRLVLADPRFSAALGGTMADGRPPHASQAPAPMLRQDPPEHTRLHRMLTSEFSFRRVAAMRPRIERIVEAALDDLTAAGPGADLVEHFAMPFASMTIAELLGVPYADRADFQSRSRVVVGLGSSPRQVGAALADMHAYMHDLIARRRPNPGTDDLIGRMLTTHGNALDDAELAGVSNLLLVAGHETTANMLGLGTLLLLQNPEHLVAMRDDPSAVDPLIEELLRYLSVAQLTVSRRATEDVDLNGQLIRAGEDVICAIPTANRDEALVQDADRFDPGRRPAAHLAFGHGIHQCLGQQLARLELRVAYPALLNRFPGLRLAVPAQDLTFREESFTYGVDSMPVAW